MTRAERAASQRRSSSTSLDTLAAVLNLVRSGRAHTRQDLERVSGLGRTVVADRVATLLDLGLLSEEGLGPSTGGRAPRQVRFNPEAGFLLVASLGTTTLGVGLTDLSAEILIEHHEPVDPASGPTRTIRRILELFDWMLNEQPGAHQAWAITLGVPGLVGPSGGRLGERPTIRHMVGWAEYPVAEELGARYEAPVLVDNAVHHMALGELRAGRGAGRSGLVFVKIGTGITAAVCSDGRLYRGTSGFAGDIGHVAVADDSGIVCRCGNTGCLEALVGGMAIAREGYSAAVDGQSLFLAERLEEDHTISAWHVGMAANRGDPFSARLISRCGQMVGETLAPLIAGIDPSLVVVGGGVSQAGAILVSAVRDGIYRRSRSVATENLQVMRSVLGKTAGLIGGAEAALDDLFDAEHLKAWIEQGSPRRGSLTSSTAAREHVPVSQPEEESGRDVLEALGQPGPPDRGSSSVQIRHVPMSGRETLGRR
jgi:predicted NBD/HSP70 family sugar kinase